MQLSSTTSERLAAIVAYADAQAAERDQADVMLKDARKSKEESENQLLDSIREARGQHKDGQWPVEVARKLDGLSSDFDRRSAEASRLEKAKKAFSVEADRSVESIIQIIRDARDGAGIFDNQTGAGTSWRGVMLTDVCEIKSAEHFGGQAIVTVGDFVEALKDGKVVQLLKDKVIPRYAIKRATEAVRAYAAARDIDLAVAWDGEVDASEPSEVEQTETAAEPESETEPAASGGE